MLNKKGTSLAELIVSVALISVVLVFMFRLLVDIQQEELNNYFASNNQLIRAEIIKRVEDDLNKNNLKNVSIASKNITFTYMDNSTSTITYTKDSLTYNAKDGNTRKWTLEEGWFEENALATYKKINDTYTDGFTSFIIDLKIYTSNDLNSSGVNNTLDDIMLTYVGPKF